MPVRRDLLAGGKRDDIPADNVLRRDLPHAFLPCGVRSPDTADSACADLGQPGIRRFGAVLGQRGDQRCQKDCQRNAARLEPVCAPEGEQQVQPQGAQQDADDGIAQIGEKPAPEAPPRLLRQAVTSAPAAGCFHFGGGQGMGMCRTRRNGGAGQRLHTVSSFLGENLRGCRRIVPAGARR